MAALTALQIVQEFCDLRGLPRPSAVVGSVEKTVAQYRGILSNLVRRLLRYEWSEQLIEGSFSAVAAYDQGALESLFPGYSELVADTGWATQQRIPLEGPLTERDWAARKALSISGPPYAYRLAAGHFYVTPIPPVTESFTFTYRTSYGFFDGASAIENLTADTDILLFPNNVLMAGFEAIWKRQKGEAYQDEENTFLGLIANAKAKDGLPNLALDKPASAMRPMIVIPSGNWPL